MGLEQAQKMISLYHTGFLVCAVLAALLFISSVFLFFRFNILGILKQKTGFAAQQSIRHTNEINQRSGRLQRRNPAATQKLLDDGGKAQGARQLAPVAVPENREDAVDVQKNTPPEMDTGQWTQPVAPGDMENADATTLLKGTPENTQMWVAAQNQMTDAPQDTPSAEKAAPPAIEAEETTLLSCDETQVLSPPKNGANFKINKKLVFTHTSETV